MIVKEFENYLEENGIAPKTIESYVSDINGFHHYLKEQGVKDERILHRFYVVSYKQKVVNEGFAVATINKKINSLQAYNFFLIEKGYMKEQVVFLGRDRVKIASGSQKAVEVLEEDQIHRLLFYVSQKDNVAQRNELIIYLLLYTGVRVTELCQIKLNNIDFVTKHLSILGKGGKHREIPLRAEVVEKIKMYLKEERQQSKHSMSEYLLISQRAAKLGRDAINTVLEKIGIDLKIKLYPHLFRHTFCTILIQKGVDLVTVSRLAGHHSVTTTTQFYVNTSRQDKQQAVNLL